MAITVPTKTAQAGESLPRIEGTNGNDTLEGADVSTTSSGNNI